MILVLCQFGIREFNPLCAQIVRYRHFMRGKPPGIARSLKQRLEERNWTDASLNFKVNIGFSPNAPVKNKERIEHYRDRKDASLERQARLRQLFIPLDEVKKEWSRSIGPHHIKSIAEHYGIYDHLFGDAYFYPIVPLDIKFESNDIHIPAYYGNIIKPDEAANQPQVVYEADEGTLWTLILTNPDGNFRDTEAECVHWFLGNIPGNNLSKGEEIFRYLQPFPPRGIGFQRLIFVLYKQDKRIDYDAMKKQSSNIVLSERTFKTEDFYRKHQDVLTPAGLAFFQSDWHPSLTDFFHNVLVMKEPSFEYEFPKPYIKPQVWFPKGQPFNLYLDKYRDEKEIAKEFLLKKLKKEHPFEKPPPPPKYPNVFSFDKRDPSWLRLEKKKERLGWGRINDY